MLGLLRGATVFALLLIISCLVAAEEKENPPTPAPPKSPAAVAAMREYGKSARDAEEIYKHARIAAETKLIQKLKIAMSTATKAGSLEEANAINAQITAANIRMADLTPKTAKPDGLQFIIDANKDWQPTVKVRRGQRIRIVADGKWCSNTNRRDTTTCGPDGIGDRGWLEGRIAEGHVLKIGGKFEFVADNDGMLSLEMNDSVRDDNDGSVTAYIVVR